MNKAEINIFIENDYETFEKETLNLSEYTKDAVSMAEFFLSKNEWIEKSCLRDYDFSLLYFDVVFVNDEKIHEINKEYRQKDRPTDVISFAMFADSPEEERFIFDNEINLGEIIISLDTTSRQAKENNKSFKDELYFLLAHGILHLLGYDHMTEETLQEMWDIQNKMIAGIKE